jgi:hypothetical protein
MNDGHQRWKHDHDCPSFHRQTPLTCQPQLLLNLAANGARRSLRWPLGPLLANSELVIITAVGSSGGSPLAGLDKFFEWRVVFQPYQRQNGASG